MPYTTMVAGGPAFAAEQQDPQWASIHPAPLAHIECPVLLTQGDRSPRWFREIFARVTELVEVAEVHTYPGAGHSPHLSNPDDYLARTTAFLAAACHPSLVR